MYTRNSYPPFLSDRMFVEQECFRFSLWMENSNRSGRLVRLNGL
ncbi:hypothetical protein Krac_4449 [Ktedonobacter racemifer DSM 44963]|uniref:Uncharacterized protein n=1 Tax=Ktedonobacter racemifer DSM 44963 TaxID=485913 RepID=D6TST3_KTERA|nr:hypothetical protein Krac_4449 [Ktedonobacter racemifer DSM 44963]